MLIVAVCLSRKGIAVEPAVPTKEPVEEAGRSLLVQRPVPAAGVDRPREQRRPPALCRRADSDRGSGRLDRPARGSYAQRHLLTKCLTQLFFFV